MFGLRAHNAKAWQKNYKCFKCNGQHNNSMCTFGPKAVTTRVAKFETILLNKIKNKIKNTPHKTDAAVTTEEILLF